MSSFDQLCIQIAKMFLTFSRRQQIKAYLRQAGYSRMPYMEIGRIFVLITIGVLLWYVYFVFTAGLEIFGLLVVLVLSSLFIFIAEVLVMFITFMIIKLYLEVKSYNRIQSIEQNLPLFLREFSTNLKAGREFVDALENSTEPEMEWLHDDVCQMVVEIRSGKMIEKVFEDYIRRYESSIIEETFQIILDAYKGGSSLSEVIDKIAENLEVIFYLRKEAVASVSNYVIFMSLVSLLIAPMLFALSYNLLDMIYKLLFRVLVSGASDYLPYNIIALDIDFKDFKLFSQLAIAAIAGSAAAVIGIIKKGSIRGSSFIILIFVAISILMYYFFTFLLGLFFEALKLKG